MRIYLLGLPRAEYLGGVLAVPRRQVRALLFRLAARRNLSRLLPQLRSALRVPQVLVITGDQVWLDPDHIWSDTATFERLCAEREPQCQIDAFAQAIDLYRGPFLDAFSLPGSPEFESWISLEREGWQQLYLKLLAFLVEKHVTREDYAAAIMYARRYLETDDLAEDIHRRLVELYAAVGDRSAALRQYERCAATLERELGVSPLPETQAIVQAVLEGRWPWKEPALPAPSPAEGSLLKARPASTVPRAEPEQALPAPDVPLVGREDALRKLEQAYARVQAGKGEIVLISGEPGIGKSRLMQDFAARLQERDRLHRCLVLVGAGYPDAQTMPYQPVVQALRQGLMAQSIELSVSRAWLVELSRLMPELYTLYPDLPQPVQSQPDEARGRLFEALYQVILGQATSPKPVLLCLDDLHWADQVTLDWLAYLARKISGSRVMVIGTYRSQEAAAVVELRQSLSRQGVILELPLAGLDGAAVLEILRHQVKTGFQAPDDTALADRLQKTTGGNPFFLLETVRALIETSALSLIEAACPARPERSRGEPVEGACPEPVEGGRQPGYWTGQGDLPLPDTVRDAVQVRIGRLSPKARQVLEAGAVLGPVFSFEAAHMTAGRGEMETIAGLDELVARQLLLEQATGYRFCHEIVREGVYQGLSLWRCRLLHRRAGEALERLHPNDAAALAFHFERAEEPGQAARYTLRAGQAAKAVFAHARARACFDRALTLLEREAARLWDPEAIAANQRLQVQALYERGWALRLLGDMQAYEHDLPKVKRLAEMLGDAPLLAHLRWREAYTHRWFCRYAEARDAAEEGIRLSQAVADRSLEAMCWREVGRAARATGDYGDAQMALERALSLFAGLGDVVHELHALSNLSTLYWRLGEHERAMHIALQALARCDEAELPLERRLPLGDIGAAAAAAAGDVDLAWRCLLESLSIARQIADRTQEIFCLAHLGWLCVQQKRAPEALEHLHPALALAERIGSRAEQSWLHSGLAEAYRLLGNPDRAVEHARRALELAQATGRSHDQRLAQSVLDELETSDL